VGTDTGISLPWYDYAADSFKIFKTSSDPNLF
jgi:hypothetical protein